MCGIIGIISNKSVASHILKGLKRLEYRGYDSAGIATISNNSIYCVKSQGKLKNLEEEFIRTPIQGNIGIGHTRWATHGEANTINAHPHVTEKVAVVHNGIIENYLEIKEELKQKNIKFTSDTDTEVIPKLIHLFLDEGLPPEDAAIKAFDKLEGAFALAVIFAENPEFIMVTRKGLPLSIGINKEESYIGSDAYSLSPFTKNIIYLEDGDIAKVAQGNVEIFDYTHNKVERPIKHISLSQEVVGKGEYKHFMLKEINEQPNVIADTLNVYCNPITNHITLPELPFSLKDIKNITIVACGTSFYAGMVAKYWFEELARVHVDVEIASEFRYRNPVLTEGGLAIFISQSGETADTIAALRFAKERKQHILTIVNVPESSIEREADICLGTLAGPEIGVASTKAYTAQLMVLSCFALALAEERSTLNVDEIHNYVNSLKEIPARLSELLKIDDQYHKTAQFLVDAKDILYIGRGTAYAIALEGALKLKELSYIHAEAIAAGELKHGTIALIDENTPVIALAPYDHLFAKTASNIREVTARNGKILLISDDKGIEKLKDVTMYNIAIKESNILTAPFLYVIPLQMIAYHVASLKGTDVDQPRNLAKSVTVE